MPKIARETPFTNTDYFVDLRSSYLNTGISCNDKYGQMRRILENVCRALTEGVALQFPNLFARLNYLIREKGVRPGLASRLHDFRIRANNAVHNGGLDDEAQLGQDVRALAEGIAALTQTSIPEELKHELPPLEPLKRRKPEGKEHRRIRVEVLVIQRDQEKLLVVREDQAGEDGIVVSLSREHLGQEFEDTVRQLWVGAQLNLVDVTESEDGTLYPKLIILEPDFLIDVTGLAGCFTDYGESPLHYFKNNLSHRENTVPILLGNAANYLLDVAVNLPEGEPRPAINGLLKRIFQSAAFDFSANADMQKPETMTEFVNNSTAQYNNIFDTINRISQTAQIRRQDAILEPSFLCETLGIQGRMDFYHQQADGRTTILELKSGKTPWPHDDYRLISPSHEVQVMLYEMAAQYSLGNDYRSIAAHVFYSKYASDNLRATGKTRSRQKKILNLRNLIVANEHQLLLDTSGNAVEQLMSRITPQELLPRNWESNKLLKNYIQPQLVRFAAPFAQADELSMKYFCAYYSFVCREQWLAKAGDNDSEQSSGVAGIWGRSKSEKLEAGDILCDLTIVAGGNKAHEETGPTIRFSIPDYGTSYQIRTLPNFRKGDLVMVYAQQGQGCRATEAILLKGSIAEIGDRQVTVRLRHPQRNSQLLSPDKTFALEHDFLDSSFTAMFRGLYSFLSAPRERRDLLLGTRRPQTNAAALAAIEWESEAHVHRAMLKAAAAKDYFLLVGPPGTGKTSRALRNMVEHTLEHTDQNILLLAYTNRAVDEICKALDTIPGSPPYIRIGQEMSCEDRYRPRLLEKVIADCPNRQSVLKTIEGHRIFVGTTSSLAGKLELFRLKQFGTAIIDEASQILEPQLLSVLCAKNGSGGCAVDKFILIGDYKQLPAVVQQPAKDSAVIDPGLHVIGLDDRRNSLFERLYRLCKQAGESLCYDMLYQQGRMHPELQAFPGRAFYNDLLQPVPTDHQKEKHHLIQYDASCQYQSLIANQRLAFIPSRTQSPSKGEHAKDHAGEAAMAARLAHAYYQICVRDGKSFEPEKQLGIIAPYRSQIALIRQQLEAFGEPRLNAITVDTVERYQGSERDCIIYSFCVNRTSQIRFLSNIILDDEQLIDRKLNVVLTRAREQLFLTGNETLLSSDAVYQALMRHCKETDAWVTLPED